MRWVSFAAYAGSIALVAACSSTDADEATTGDTMGIDSLGDGAPTMGDDDGDGGPSSMGTGGTGDSGGASSPMDDGDAPKFDVAGPSVDVPAVQDCVGLVATIRDFHASHPDFETYGGSQAYTGLVDNALGGDQTPVYNPAYSGPPMITSAATFADWYHDVAGVNEPFPIELPLTDLGDGTFQFDSNAFFPLDGMGFGNEGNAHNFHFTTEVHTSFTYHGGEVFTFRGDDDVWMFVAGQLALDLGGLHSALEGTIDMDTLGLTVGVTYPMDIFHAERHTNESNFRIVTTIECFEPPVG